MKKRAREWYTEKRALGEALHVESVRVGGLRFANVGGLRGWVHRSIALRRRSGR